MTEHNHLNPVQPESEEDTLLLDDLHVVFDRRTAPASLEGAPSDELTGRQIGRYVVGRLLGEGGMARVYQAIECDSQQRVALKTLKPQYRADQGLCARFEREARSMARIQHDHVVRILDFPHEDMIRAIVTEFLPNGSLRDRLNAARKACQPLGIAEALAGYRI